MTYGTSTAALTSTATVRNPSVSSTLIENLAPGTWYFAVKAYTSTGNRELHLDHGVQDDPVSAELDVAGRPHPSALGVFRRLRSPRGSGFTRLPDPRGIFRPVPCPRMSFIALLNAALLAAFDPS